MSEFTGIATEILKDLGAENFSIIRVIDMPINPDTGLPYLSFSVPLIDDLSIHSFHLPPVEESTIYFGALTHYDQSLINGSNIQTGDKLLLLQPEAVFRLGDVIRIIEGENAGRYTVVNQIAVEPAGELLLWKFQLRRQ